MSTNTDDPSSLEAPPSTPRPTTQPIDLPPEKPEALPRPATAPINLPPTPIAPLENEGEDSPSTEEIKLPGKALSPPKSEANREEFIAEVVRLTENASTKRKQLLHIAEAMVVQRRKFFVVSGLLALGASSAFAGILDAFLPIAVCKLIASLLSLTAGVITLMNSVSMKEVEIVDAYESANNYLKITEQCASLLLASDDLSRIQAKRRIDEMKAEYVKLDASSSKWIFGGLFAGMDRKTWTVPLKKETERITLRARPPGLETGKIPVPPSAPRPATQPIRLPEN